LHDQGLEILAFPCNQFGRQEPKSNAEVKAFAESKGATFPLFEKINVNGSRAHPIYTFLRAKIGGIMGSSIKWNFTKFLCDRNGVPIERYSPPTKPSDMKNDILELLNKN
jgi:glutathione peroxidase-family protein